MMKTHEWPQPIWPASSADAVRAARAGVAEVNPLIRAAFYVFVFSIPFEMPDRTIPVEIPTLTGAIFLLTTVLQPSLCFRRLPAPFVWFAIYLWAFGIVVLINQVEYTISVAQLFVWKLQVVLLFWVTVNILADGRVLRGLLLTLVAACTLRAGLQLVGIGVSTHEVYTGGSRVTMFGQNTNLTAMILAAGLAAVIGLQLSRYPHLPRLGLLTWPVAAIICLAILQSGSRGGLLSAGVALAAFLLRGGSAKQRLRNGVLAVAGLAVLAWGASRTEVMRNRFEVATADGHLAGREEIYPALAQMFREQPFFGWGPIANQFEIARRIEDRDKARRDAHNLVGELLTAGGLFAAVPFLIGMFLCICAAWRARHGPLELTPVAMLGAVLVGTTSGTWITAKILWLVLAVGLAAGTYCSGVPHGLTPGNDRRRAPSCAA